MRSLIKKLVFKNNTLRRLFQKYKLKTDLNQPITILVYSTGKVGSTSVYKSLKKHDSSQINACVFHIHYLRKEMLDRLEYYVNKNNENNTVTTKNLLLGTFLRKKIKNGFDYKNRFKIVTGVRDIVALDISNFFERLIHNVDFDYNRLFTEDIDTITSELLKEFNKHIESKSYKLLKWLDLEIKNVMGLDVFASEFRMQKGYQIYKGDYPDTLLYRLEDLDNISGQIFEDFLGIKQFKLINK